MIFSHQFFLDYYLFIVTIISYMFRSFIRTCPLLINVATSFFILSVSPFLLLHIVSIPLQELEHGLVIINVYCQKEMQIWLFDSPVGQQVSNRR
jgi:hypothetical protein